MCHELLGTDSLKLTTADIGIIAGFRSQVRKVGKRRNGGRERRGGSEGKGGVEEEEEEEWRRGEERQE